jgi:hypothetical protein
MQAGRGGVIDQSRRTDKRSELVAYKSHHMVWFQAFDGNSNTSGTTANQHENAQYATGGVEGESERVLDERLRADRLESVGATGLRKQHAIQPNNHQRLNQQHSNLDHN